MIGLAKVIIKHVFIMQNRMVKKVEHYEEIVKNIENSSIFVSNHSFSSNRSRLPLIFRYKKCINNYIIFKKM
jgi:hypothetical protein